MSLIQKKDGFKSQRHLAFPPDLLHEARQVALRGGSQLHELGYYPTAKYHYRERFNEETENILIYCIDGAGTIELGNDLSFVLKRGDAFCIPRQTAHRYYADETNPWSILWAHFETTLNKELGLNKHVLYEITSPEKNALIQSQFIQLFDIAEYETSLTTVICTSQLLQLILTEIVLLKDGLTHDKQQLFLSKAITYLNENIAESITLGDLACYLDISQSYLSSIFKKYLNQSPIDYLIEIRIEQACRYLKMTDLKIYEIAKKVGYQDPYYFSRLFKRMTKQTPKSYREQVTYHTLS